MTVTIATLYTVETAASILATGLEVAEALGLSTTTWRDGDPTRAGFKFLASVLASRENIQSEFIKAGFLSTATGDWLTVIAEEVYGVVRDPATYATSEVEFTNTGGGHFPMGVGDVTVKSTTSGKTYHNTEAFTLSGVGDTATVSFEADEAGSGSAAGLDEIDDLVTTMLGVTVDSSTVASATDEQSDASLRTSCENTLGALSPNGPADAYEYVVTASDLTGESTITRATSIEDSSTGLVTVYVAGASGVVAGAAVTAAQDAIEEWATPLCVTPTAVASTAASQGVTATISGDDIPAGFEATCSAAFATLYGALPASEGLLARSALISTIQTLAAAGGATNVTVSLTVPASDSTAGVGEIHTLGAVNVTEV